MSLCHAESGSMDLQVRDEASTKVGSGGRALWTKSDHVRFTKCNVVDID